MAGLALSLAACAAPTDTTSEVEQTEAVGQATEELRHFTPRLERLGELGVQDLQALYESGTTEGGLPAGQGVGRAFFLGFGLTKFEDELHRAGLPTARTVEDLIANAVWHGKTFTINPSTNGEVLGTLTNKVLGLDLATANIRYIGQSTVADEANTFYLDYSQSNLFLVRGIQDYIRKVGEGLYVGKAFLKVPTPEGRVLACYFALDFQS
jgi:hypothetical protein